MDRETTKLVTPPKQKQGLLTLGWIVFILVWIWLTLTTSQLSSKWHGLVFVFALLLPLWGFLFIRRGRKVAQKKGTDTFKRSILLLFIILIEGLYLLVFLNLDGGTEEGFLPLVIIILLSLLLGRIGTTKQDPKTDFRLTE